MTEKQKEAIAVFRYGVITDFVNGISLAAADRKRLLEAKSGQKWRIPHSPRTSISQNTIRRWIRRYKREGFEGLKPLDRSDLGKTRALDEDTCSALIALRTSKPDLPVAGLIELMNKDRLSTPGIKLSDATVYRFLKANGLMELNSHKPVDRRKFEAELPNDLWQSDVMHGPKLEYLGKKRKTYLIAFIDDQSRLIPYARFYFSENLDSFLHAFFLALKKRGLPRKLYVDNGAAYRSKKLEYITAELNITLVHAKPYTPQGKGKIERWFKTIRSSFLPTCKATTLEDLNAKLSAWVENHYHARKHGATGQAPFDRFGKHLKCPRYAPENLHDFFRTIDVRRVAKDRTITLRGRLFEAPVALIGKRVELLYHDLDSRWVEIRHEQKSYGKIEVVDVKKNCRVKRDKNNNAELEIKEDKIRGGDLF